MHFKLLMHLILTTTAPGRYSYHPCFIEIQRDWGSCPRSHSPNIQQWQCWDWHLGGRHPDLPLIWCRKGWHQWELPQLSIPPPPPRPPPRPFLPSCPPASLSTGGDLGSEPALLIRCPISEVSPSTAVHTFLSHLQVGQFQAQ